MSELEVNWYELGVVREYVDCDVMNVMDVMDVMGERRGARASRLSTAGEKSMSLWSVRRDLRKCTDAARDEISRTRVRRGKRR